MALTDAQRLAREGKLTASRVAPLMTGDKAKIMAVWRELCGDPSYEEPDLSEVWAVQMGVVTEPLNLEWYTRTTGHELTRKGEVVFHPDYSWAAATLDAFDASLPGPVEAKCVSGFEKYEVVRARYIPQVMWQMECLNARKCAFSVIQGGRQPYVDIIEYDKDYATELMSRAKKFMEHVYSMTPPVELEAVEAPKISRLRDYEMTGDNIWAAAASDFLQHKNAAKMFKDAETRLRERIPADAGQCTGYGVVAKRDRALRISIRAADDGDGSKRRS